jgi:adenylate cyclase
MVSGMREALSEREQEIAIAYAQGASYKEIARRLGIAPATVRAHLRTIYAKIGVSSKIELLRTLDEGNARPDRAEIDTDPIQISGLRLVVLPFAKSSAESENTYVTDGIAEDIATELSRFHQLTVLSSSSSIRLDEAQDPIVEAQSLGLHYLVDGKIRRPADSVRITVRLIQVESGHQVWSENFDRKKYEIFAVQDEIMTRIVGSIAGRIQAAGADRVRKKLPENLAAYECVLRGRSLATGYPEAEAEARRLYERAIELDPEYALAYARLAHMLTLEWDRDLRCPDDVLDRALELAKKAVSLDANDPACQQWLGFVHLFRREFDRSEEHFTRAIELNPNDADLTAAMGLLQSFLGKSNESLAWLQHAQDIDPYFEPAGFWHARGIAYFIAERFAESIAAFEHSVTMPVWVKAYLAAACALSGDIDAAARYKLDILRVSPEFSRIRFADREPLQRSVDRNLLIAGMRGAGLPE